MPHGKGKARAKQKDKLDHAEDGARGADGASSNEKNDSKSASAKDSKLDEPSSTAETMSSKLDELLGNFKVQVTLRVAYGILSSYGMYAMIREHPKPIFRGWNTLLISLVFLLNIVLGLAASNREIKICWVFVRSVTHWRFFWALISIYPEHCLRVAVISAVAAAYSYWFTFDRKATTALVASLGLVLSDTPKLRKHIWKGERRVEIQTGLGFLCLAFLGGWRLYRWFALAGMFFANDMLLTMDFVPSAGGADRLQVWFAGAVFPVAVVYHWAAEKGLPSYGTPLAVVVLLIALRPNCPNDGIKIARSMFIGITGILLELFAFGLTAKMVMLSLFTLVYILVN